MAKRGGGADDIYDAHIFGAEGRYKRNTDTNNEQISYMFWVRQITNLAVNRFKWEGLPESVDVRFMEMCLFHYALSIFYHDDDLDNFLAVQGAGTAYVNMLQNPVAFTAIGPGPAFTTDQQTMLTKTLSAYNPATNYDLIDKDPKKSAIPIWANYIRTPDLDGVMMYARRIAMIERTIEINAKNMRMPKVLKANQNNQLTLTNIARQQDQGAEVIIINGESIDMSDIDVLDLSISDTQLSSLAVQRTRWFNECMNFLGIDNSNQDKKERLVASEVDANNTQTDSFRYVQLNARRQACEQINKVHGLNISVEYNVEVEAMASQVAEQNNIGEEEKDNG